MYWLGCLHSCGWDLFVLVLDVFYISFFYHMYGWQRSLRLFLLSVNSRPWQYRNFLISQQKVPFVDCWHYFLRQCSSEHGNERNNATQNLVTLCGANRITRKREDKLTWPLPLLVAFVWFSWQAFPWCFSDIAQLFGKIADSHHCPETGLCSAPDPPLPWSSWGRSIYACCVPHQML